VGLFTSKQNTISDKKMADLQRRARKANPDWTSARSARMRKASSLQRSKRRAS
jgi:hypothetical protein